MSWSASWCTWPHDGCTCKFKLHVFYDLHAVSPAFFYAASSCLQWKKHIGFYMVIKSHIRQTIQKAFYAAWDFTMIFFPPATAIASTSPRYFLLFFSGLEASYSKHCGAFYFFLSIYWLLLWVNAWELFFHCEGAQWWRFVMTTSVCPKQMLE